MPTIGLPTQNPLVPGKPVAPVPGAPNNNTYGQLSSIIPGLTDLTKTGTDVIQEMLKGLPSPSTTRTANAYFGIGSGAPGSEFIRNRGYDLYGRQAQQRQQQGLGDLLSFLGQYQQLVPTPGQNLSTGLGYAQLGQAANEFNTTNAFNQWLAQQQLGLDWANLGSRFA